jgi:hypothetical protein
MIMKNKEIKIVTIIKLIKINKSNQILKIKKIIPSTIFGSKIVQFMMGKKKESPLMSTKW